MLVNCLAVFLSYFSYWICYEIQLTNTKIQMSQTSRLRKAINYYHLQPCKSFFCCSLNFVKDFSFWFFCCEQNKFKIIVGLNLVKESPFLIFSNISIYCKKQNKDKKIVALQLILKSFALYKWVYLTEDPSQPRSDHLNFII